VEQLAALSKAVREGEERLAARGRLPRTDSLEIAELVRALQDPVYLPRRSETETLDAEKKSPRVKARKLIGQPAGLGIATGRVHVIRDPSELFQFQKGEILVCDAVDPT
jgi:hypothetical protein